MDRQIITVAHRIERELWATYQEYLADCESDARQGHRSHYCEHGFDLWTDYDNICGGCEEGVSMADGLTRRTYALRQAHECVERAQVLTLAAVTMRRARIDFDEKEFTHTLARLLFVPASAA